MEAGLLVTSTRHNDGVVVSAIVGEAQRDLEAGLLLKLVVSLILGPVVKPAAESLVGREELAGPVENRKKEGAFALLRGGACGFLLGQWLVGKYTRRVAGLGTAGLLLAGRLLGQRIQKSVELAYLSREEQRDEQPASVDRST